MHSGIFTILTHSISKESCHLHSLPWYFYIDGVDVIFLLLMTLTGNVVCVDLRIQILYESCYRWKVSLSKLTDKSKPNTQAVSNIYWLILYTCVLYTYTWLILYYTIHFACIAIRGRYTRLAWLANPNPNPDPTNPI